MDGRTPGWRTWQIVSQGGKGLFWGQEHSFEGNIAFPEIDFELETFCSFGFEAKLFPPPLHACALNPLSFGDSFSETQTL